MNISWIIGQLLGVVAIILGIISYQVKTDKKLLFVLMLNGAVFAVHYYLLGAMPAAVMNTIGVVRNIVYYGKDKKFYNPVLIPAIFAVIMGVMGLLSWQGPESILVIAGLVINTVCVSFKNPQNIRKSILVTSPMVLVYDAYAGSIGGVIYEAMVVVSSIIGIIRYKNKK